MSSYRTASDMNFWNLIKPDGSPSIICNKQDGEDKMTDSSNESTFFVNAHSPPCKEIIDVQKDYVSSPEMEPTKDKNSAYFAVERSHNRRWKSESNLSSKSRSNRSHIPLPAAHSTVSALSESFDSSGARPTTTSSVTLTRLSLRRSGHSSSQPVLSRASPIPDYSWVPSVVSSRIREQRRRDRDWRARRDLRVALDSALLEEIDGARLSSNLNQEADGLSMEKMTVQLEKVCRERDEQTQRLHELQDRYVQLANRCAEAETFIDRVRFLPACQTGNVAGGAGLELRRYGSLGTLDDCFSTSTAAPADAGTFQPSVLGWSAGVCAGGAGTLLSSELVHQSTSHTSPSGLTPSLPGVTHRSAPLSLSRENAVDAEECSSVGGSTCGQSSLQPATPLAAGTSPHHARASSLCQKRVSWHDSLSSTQLDPCSVDHVPVSGLPRDILSSGSSPSDASPSTQLLNSTLSTLSLSTEKDLRSVSFPTNSGVSPPKCLPRHGVQTTSMLKDLTVRTGSSGPSQEGTDVPGNHSVDNSGVLGPRDDGPSLGVSCTASSRGVSVCDSELNPVGNSTGHRGRDHSCTSSRNSNASTVDCDQMDGTPRQKTSHSCSSHDHFSDRVNVSERLRFAEVTTQTPVDMVPGTSRVNETDTSSRHRQIKDTRGSSSNYKSSNRRSSGGRHSDHNSSSHRSLDRKTSRTVSKDKKSPSGVSCRCSSSDQRSLDCRLSHRETQIGVFFDRVSSARDSLDCRLSGDVTSDRRFSDCRSPINSVSDRVSSKLKLSDDLPPGSPVVSRSKSVPFSETSPGPGLRSASSAVISAGGWLSGEALSATEKVLLWQSQLPPADSSSCESADRCSRQFDRLCSAIGSLQREVSDVRRLVRQRPPSASSSPVPHASTPLRAMVRLPTPLLPDRYDISDSLPARRRLRLFAGRNSWDDKYPQTTAVVERAVQTDSSDLCGERVAMTRSTSPCHTESTGGTRDISQLALSVRRKSDCLVRRVLSQSPSRDNAPVT